MIEPSLPEESIFGQALEITSAKERAAFLDRACGNNPALRAEVEALLRAHEHSGDLLDLPENVQPTADLPANERSGTIIGPYKLLEQIGEGGMGTVWMAEQTEPIQRRVAIKVVKEGMDSREVLARFEAERQALALMDHPNIAKVLDAGQTLSGRPYFVMELVKGKPITKYCDEKCLAVRERLELFGDVCRAVQHAHQKGIIHRDIKPSNVLVAPYDSKPVVKVIDFGVAKATGQQLTDKTLFTGFGALVGTPEYMSPEQAEVNNQDIDTRSDIYSLGVLLYELLTGSTPLTRKRIKDSALLEVLRVIREEEPSRPSTRLSEMKDTLPSISAQRQTEPAKLTKLVRGELDWIAMKALEKDRNRRYDTANGFAMDEQRYLADEPVLACPPSVGYRLRKFARRNRAAVLLTAAVLALILMAGAGIWSWQHQETLRHAEREFHTELTRRSVESSLEQLPGLHARALWQDAEALLHRADQQLGPEGDGALRHQVAQARADTAFIKELDDIRLEKSVVVEGKMNYAGALPKYKRAFFVRGFDILEGDPADLAEKLNASSVRAYLLAALDDWAMTEDVSRGKRIMVVTAQATGQRWRAALADARNDGAKLAKLYDAIPSPQRTPAVIEAVGQRLDKLGQDGVSRVEEGLRQYPSDFWLHFALGWMGGKERLDARIGAYRASLALRPQTPAVHNNLGLLLADKKQYDAAIAEYKEAIRLDANLAGPHNNLGNVLRAKKQYDAAIAEYKEAIRLDPDDALPHNGLGAVHHDKKQYDAAIAEFKEAIRLDPNYAAPHTGLGNALVDKKQYDAAIAEFKEAIRLDPNLGAPHNGLGNALAGKKQYDAAIAEFKEAIRLDPDLGDPHNGLGNVLHEKKQHDAAIAEFKEAIRLDPDLADPHNGLGNVLRAKKQYEAAIAEYKEAIRLDPNYARPHNGLGNVHSDKKQYDAAIAEYKEAIRLDPNLAASHNGLGEVLRDKKQHDAAIAEFKEAIRLDPNDALPHNGLGNVHYDKKQYDAAIAEYKEAIRLDPKFALPHNGLGAVHYDKKQYDAAIAECKEAIRLDPNYATPHIGLGYVYYAKKQYDAAMVECKEAIRLDPRDALPHIVLGIVLHDKKQHDAAIAEFKEAIRLDPDFAEANCNLGYVYRDQGRFEEAVKFLRRGHELGSRRAGWPYPSAQWLKQCEQLLALDHKLAAVRRGQAQPGGWQERLDLATLCHIYKQQHAAAARFYAEAFAANPKAEVQFRYTAASSAARAAAGQGKDADKLDHKERADLRQKALAWLRDELQAATQALQNPASAAVLPEMLKHWQSDPALSSVRDTNELASCPKRSNHHGANYGRMWTSCKRK
jgi:tetratricopeptide (TPR) repeat protein